ncbi:hypothetical protein ACFL2B_01840 [Patescibacteria group bacterium]
MQIKEIIKSISKKERKIIIIAIVVVIAITTLPYIYGWLDTPEDTTYIANYHRASGDHYVYLSMIEEVKAGGITLHNLFTSEEHKAVQVRPFWFALGIIAKTFNIEARLIIQLFRIILIAISIPVIYLTISTFLKKRAPRLIAFILSLSAAGFGYLYYRFVPEIIPNIYTINFYDTPTDIWLTEGTPLLLFVASPHFQLSLICLLLSLVFFVLGFKQKNFKYLLISGGLNLFLAFFHTYETVFIILIITIYAIGFFIWGTRCKGFKQSLTYFYRWLVPILVVLPGIAYQLYIFKTEPILKSWSEQSRTISPDIQYYLWGYGLVLAFAILGAVLLIRKLNIRHKDFLLTWFIATWPLLYIPIAFNRRFIEGLFVPMGILAALGIYWLYQKFRDKSLAKRQIFILFMIFLFMIALLPTNAYNIWSFIEIQRTYKSTPFYLPLVEKEALDWLKNNTTLDDVIMSEHVSGYYIPAFAGKRVYIGHDLQTAFFEEKKKQAETFFNDNTDKSNWLKENNLTYFYYSPSEQDNEFDPTNKPYLDEVFANDSVQIYRVTE